MIVLRRGGGGGGGVTTYFFRHKNNMILKFGGGGRKFLSFVQKIFPHDLEFASHFTLNVKVGMWSVVGLYLIQFILILILILIFKRYWK